MINLFQKEQERIKTDGAYQMLHDADMRIVMNGLTFCSAVCTEEWMDKEDELLERFRYETSLSN